MTELSLLDSRTEADLRASVRDLLAARCPSAAVTRMYDGDRSIVPSVWRALADDLGVAGILIPEHLGGAGGTARDAAVVLHELGRAMAPVPFLTSSIMATTALLAARRNDTIDQALADLGAGNTVMSLAIPFSAAHTGQIKPITSGGADGLTGTIRSVAGALEADSFLVPVAGSAGVAIHQVNAGDVEISPVPSLDMSRQLADLSLDEVASTVAVEAGQGRIVLDRALAISSALLASEEVGLADWCLATTVAYVKQRWQFGRPIGSFQAPKHRLTDLYVAIETARSAASYAAAAVAADDADLLVAATVAQSFCADTAVRAAEESIQLHGGIGMTWEYPAHLYLKRAKADQSALGGPSYHRRRLAELVDLAAPPN